MLKSKRTLALLLCALMLVSVMPITAFAEINPIWFDVGTPADVVMSAGESPSNVASFTPQADGKYIFTVESPYDVAASIFDDEERTGECLASYMDYEFTLTADLAAGTEYFVFIDSHGSFDQSFVVALYVEKAPDIVSLEISQEPWDVMYYDNMLQNVTYHGLAVKATFSDDSVRYFEYGMWYEDYDVECSLDDDPESDTYGTVTVTVGGKSVDFELTIIENPIEKIEFTGKALEIVENTYCYEEFDTNTDEPYNYYYFENRLYDMGKVFKFTFKDGSVEYYSLWDDALIDYSVYTYTEQDTEHWVAGGTYTATVEYIGKTVDVPVKIVESPVKSIKIDKAPSYVYKYGDLFDGYMYPDGYSFWPTLYIDDLKFTVTYKDGKTKTYYGSDIDMYSETLEGVYCTFDYAILATEPGKYPVTLNYNGVEATYEVTLADAGIKSVELTKNPTVTTYDDYYMPSFEGAEVTITYDNNSKKVIKVTKDNIYLEYSDVCVYDETGRPIVKFSCFYDYDLDEGYVELSCYDASVRLDCMTYTEQEYDSIEIKNPNIDFENMQIVVTKDGVPTTYDLKDDITNFGGGFGDIDIIPHIFYTYTDKGIIEVTVVAGIEQRVPVRYYAYAFGNYWDTEVNEDRTLKAISIAKKSDRIRYEKGEAFDPAGIVLSLDFGGGLIGKAVYGYDEGITVSRVDTSKTGKKTVTVSYAGKSASFEIEVAEGFTDVKKGAWYEDYVNYAAEYGILQGTGDNIFSPESHLTRGQFVQILANLEGIDTKNSNIDSGYKDVAKGKWYTVAVKWASDNGIVAGFGNGLFKPEDKITREQMCVMLKNYVENYLGCEFAKVEAGIEFKDAAQISSWAKDAVDKCQRADIINGVGDGRFAPKDYAKRSEGATLFTKFHQEKPYH